MNWWILLFIVFVNVKFIVTLNGDNVCKKEEKYTTTVKKPVKKQKLVRTFEWCLKVPPRCETEKMEYVDAFETIEEEKTRYVDTCCPGFVEDASVSRCISPECKKCVNGRCDTSTGTCVCEIGYTGRYCIDKCPVNTWGQHCANVCSCRNGAACDPVSGKCRCAAGWHGESCDTECPDGQFGIDCKEKCQCPENSPCDHVSGECQPPPTEIEVVTPPPTTTTVSDTISTSRAETANMDLVTATYNLIISTTKPIVVKTTTEKYPSKSKTKSKFNKKMYVQQAITTTTSESTTTTTSTSTIAPTTFSSDIPVDEDLFTNGTSMTDAEDWPMDQAEIPHTEQRNEMHTGDAANHHQRRQRHDDNDYFGRDFISMLSVAAGVMIAIIVAAMILCFTDRSRRFGKLVARDANRNKETGVSAVLFISQSTFHRDLPEPITLLTTDFQEQPEPMLKFKSPVDDDFDKVFANTLREVFDSTYDHPPSVGTFREAGVQHRDPEHVYDEIPCWKQPTPVDTHPTRTSPVFSGLDSERTVF